MVHIFPPPTADRASLALPGAKQPWLLSARDARVPYEGGLVAAATRRRAFPRSLDGRTEAPKTSAPSRKTPLTFPRPIPGHQHPDAAVQNTQNRPLPAA